MSLDHKIRYVLSELRETSYSTLTLTYSDMDISMTTRDKILGVYVDENIYRRKFHHIYGF